jgi:adenosylcobinamide-phosphate synthase
MTAVELLLACVLDAVAGDPRWLPHPVKIIGRMIVSSERCIRQVARSAAAERAAGVFLALGLPLFAYLAGWLLIEWAGEAHALGRAVVVVVLAWTTLAGRDLVDHALAVHRALISGRLDLARSAVARIVGRDTQDLPESEIVRATVETIAESTSDGIIAPMFYLAIGGPPLALAYKAISTLDSMIGHLDERYRDLGWASARLDDAVNWIPARLSGYLIVLAAGVYRGTAAQSWRMLHRDGAKHPSPNSGRPEAAMAGALEVQLGGVNTYGGVPSERPVLGDCDRPLRPVCIREAVRVMVVASAFGAALAVGMTMTSPSP